MNFKHKEIFYIGQKFKNWLKWLIFGSKRLYYIIETLSIKEGAIPSSAWGLHTPCGFVTDRYIGI